MKVKLQNLDYPVKLEAQCGDSTKRYIIRQFPNGSIRMEKDHSKKQ